MGKIKPNIKQKIILTPAEVDKKYEIVKFDKKINKIYQRNLPRLIKLFSSDKCVLSSYKPDLTENDIKRMASTLIHAVFYMEQSEKNRMKHYKFIRDYIKEHIAAEEHFLNTLKTYNDFAFEKLQTLPEPSEIEDIIKKLKSTFRVRKKRENIGHVVPLAVMFGGLIMNLNDYGIEPIDQTRLIIELLKEFKVSWNSIGEDISNNGTWEFSNSSDKKHAEKILKSSLLNPAAKQYKEIFLPSLSADVKILFESFKKKKYLIL